MEIKKGDTHINVPGWVVILGIAGMIDIVSIIANAATVKKLTR